MKKEIVKESDVGQLSLFEETANLIKLNVDYASCTSDISYNIDNIFENYLDIGRLLNTVKRDKLYLANEYKNVYDYAAKEFDLSKTTTKNVISIFVRFCHEDTATLLEKYKGFTFSNLTELLSVSDEDIANFAPSMTTKAVRSKKLELTVNKNVKKLFSSKAGDFPAIIGIVSEFNWKAFLDNEGVSISHTVNLPDYVNAEGDWSTDNYHVEVEFTLSSKNSLKKFVLLINFNDATLVLKSEYCPWFRYDTTFEKLHVLENLNKIAKNFKSYFADSKVESIQNIDYSPGVYSIERLHCDYDERLHVTELQKTIIEAFKGHYYEEKGSSVYIFKSGKRHKKNNPLVCEIKNFENPAKAVFVSAKDDIEIPIFPGFNVYLMEQMERFSNTIDKID